MTEFAEGTTPSLFTNKFSENNNDWSELNFKNEDLSSLNMEKAFEVRALALSMNFFSPVDWNALDNPITVRAFHDVRTFSSIIGFSLLSFNFLSLLIDSEILVFNVFDDKLYFLV